jgi:RimJ/RimL family protein N-acetyltransferase
MDLGRNILLATIMASNEKSMSLAKRLGFREVFRGRDWFTHGSDLVWLEMRREDCRWLAAPAERKKVA